MSAPNVQVSGISPTTTEKSLHDFFTFCGRITKIDYKADTKSATVYFEKASAAKTALMLNDGTLDGANLIVTSDVEHKDEEAADESTPIDQTDKPRAGIAAEYIARGYTLHDSILQRAIEIDNKQGISKRFLNYFNQFDQAAGARALGPDQTLSKKLQETLSQAAAQAKIVDKQKGYTKVAHDYYSKAVTSPLGQQVFSFYTSTSKQIMDIHAEARRIADQQKVEASSTTTTAGISPNTATPTNAATETVTKA